MGSRCTVAFESLWIERLLYDYQDILIESDATKSHHFLSFFGNRMVVVHQSLSKCRGTRSAKAFSNEGIVVSYLERILLYGFLKIYESVTSSQPYLPHGKAVMNITPKAD